MTETRPSVEFITQRAVDVEWPLDIPAISDPGNPATNHMRLFNRTNGNNLELVSRGPLGTECILCTKQNITAVPKLYLNLVA